MVPDHDSASLLRKIRIKALALRIFGPDLRLVESDPEDAIAERNPAYLPSPWSPARTDAPTAAAEPEADDGATMDPADAHVWRRMVEIRPALAALTRAA